MWLSGYENGYSSSFGFYFGTTILNFNNTPRTVTYDSSGIMWLDKTTTSYCNSDGSLLFYTNGIYIANGLYEKIENSDSLNWGPVIEIYLPDMYARGYRIPQGIIAIKVPSTDNQYYLLHSYLDTLSNNNFYGCLNVLTTLLDMNENAGHGKVIYKNQSQIRDTINWDVTVCKHANGRDWWLLTKQNVTNCYYKTLISSVGISTSPAKQCIGWGGQFGNVSNSCYSPDGTKYAVFVGYGGLDIFDFDRCSGELSNPLHASFPLSSAMGVAFSPNSRFLYLSLYHVLYQFDMQAPDILASKDTVGVFDGTKAPFDAIFYTAQLAPDGKIYISCGNADTVYHVIERPDEKGDSCLFKQHSLSLPSPSLGVPNFPNYRLGALPGSPCDTLTGLNEVEKEKLLKVYPNPATDFVVVDYGFTNWNKGEVSLEVTNELGQITLNKKIPMYSGLQKIDVTPFASGVYQVFIKRGLQTVATTKFAKQ